MDDFSGFVQLFNTSGLAALGVYFIWKEYTRYKFSKNGKDRRAATEGHENLLTITTFNNFKSEYDKNLSHAHEFREEIRDELKSLSARIGTVETYQKIILKKLDL